MECGTYTCVVGALFPYTLAKKLGNLRTNYTSHLLDEQFIPYYAEPALRLILHLIFNSAGADNICYFVITFEMSVEGISR